MENVHHQNPKIRGSEDETPTGLYTQRDHRKEVGFSLERIN